MERLGLFLFFFNLLGGNGLCFFFSIALAGGLTLFRFVSSMFLGDSLQDETTARSMEIYNRFCWEFWTMGRFRRWIYLGRLRKSIVSRVIFGFISGHNIIVSCPIFFPSRDVAEGWVVRCGGPC